MKLNTHVLGLLFAAATLPAVAGCAAETGAPEPGPTQAKQIEQSQSQAHSQVQGEVTPPTEGTSESSPPAEKDARAEEPKSEDVDGGPATPTPEDPCPPCGMG